MKKLFTFFLLIFCLIPIVSGCTPKNQTEEPPIIDPDKENENDDNNNQTQVIEVKDGTAIAKILLANERLDESVLEKSGTLFTDGKKAMARIIDKTRQYLKRNAGRPNETYTEVDGDTIKWYNDVDYSNFMSFFESYAVNIEFNAERSADLIEYTKKYIRVVNKWVHQHGNEYYLKVEENSETIINRIDNYVSFCKRYTDENGKSVYEMLQNSDDTITRMKYIPNLLYEFSIQFLKEPDSIHYLYADNSKGYWTILSSGPINSYTDPHIGEVETFTPTIVVLKEEANYKMNYFINNEGRSEIHGIDIISSDSKTDLISMGIDNIMLYNTGIKGLDHLEITAPKDKVGDFDPDSDEQLYVYEQDNFDDKGNPYKIYSTSGFKSATAVLENGMTLNEYDILLDGKVIVNRIDVSYVAGCDSYGRIPLMTTASTYDEQFVILEEFLELTEISFRRDFNDVINGIKYALKDAKSFGDYFTWNGCHLNTIDSVEDALAIENSKVEELIALYNEVKDSEVIDIEDQEKYDASIHFSDIEITNLGTVSNDGFNITITDFSVKVKDTLLFTDQEEYKIVFALLNKEGNLISFLDENDLKTQYNKGNEFLTTQTKTFVIDTLKEGEYVLVSYVATAEEGIRITNYVNITAEVTEFTRNEYGYINIIHTNENKELIIKSEVNYDLYYEYEGDLTYEILLQFMGQIAYDHGMIDELIIEKFDGENWVLVEEPKIDEENPVENENQEEITDSELTSEQPENQEETTNSELTPEQPETPEEVIETLEKGQYRMKYIVNSEEQKEAYVYVTVK